MISLPESQLGRLRREFESQFGAIRWIAAAPGRVNLMGEHVDYNDGFVLPFAIDRYTAIAGGPATDPQQSAARIFSLETGELCQIPLRQRPIPVPGHWSNYAAGVVDGFLEEGITIPPFNAVIHSAVPAGSGLSSSAALEVATATLLERITSCVLDWKDKVLLCQRAEHRFAGVPCGVMDQIASVRGESGAVLLIDCRDMTVEPIPMRLPGARVVIVNSRVHHELADGEYARRRQECREALALAGKTSFRDVTRADVDRILEKGDEVLFRRARHVASESARTVQAARCLQVGDLEGLCNAMEASHHSMKTDFEISCPEIDELVDAATKISYEFRVGSRMTGGGFGGCTINIVPETLMEHFRLAMQSVRYQGTVIQPEIFEVIPSRGAMAADFPI